ncbi:unnamed protein product [Gadus morhua 'NCC']
MSLKEKAIPDQAMTNIRKVSRTVYCMNEKELVEAAIAFISQGEVNGDRRLASAMRIQDCSKQIEETLGESSSSYNQDRTYISETDMDTVEDAQTLSPHLYFSGQQSEGQRQQSEGQRSLQARDSQSPVAPETGPTVVAESPPTEVEEDDSFKLVREIFFTKD